MGLCVGIPTDNVTFWLALHVRKEIEYSVRLGSYENLSSDEKNFGNTLNVERIPSCSPI